LVAIQVLLLNHIRFGGYINPWLYVMFILILPFETPKWLLLVSAFILGYTIDLFSSTPGMHAASAVFMAFCRPAVIKLSMAKQEFYPGANPSVSVPGFRSFLIYSLILVALHHSALYFIEMFHFREITATLYRIAINTGFTLLLIIIASYISDSKSSN
jgi:rod shape-determining protein MreD